MTRVKRGVAASKRRKNLLKDAKGYRWNRKNLYREAKQAVIKAGSYAYRDRRTKKRSARALWITRLNIASRIFGVKYSDLVAKMKAKNIELDRKVLSQIAVENPPVFEKIIAAVK
ncbi:MAG: 50S ribosomal protein L20 [Candidatus Moranbacteria bacterium]|nr:50S ribosomal protein L20 [Candidatus Moranbacteria bacterium]